MYGILKIHIVQKRNRRYTLTSEEPHWNFIYSINQYIKILINLFPSISKLFYLGILIFCNNVVILVGATAVNMVRRPLC